MIYNELIRDNWALFLCIKIKRMRLFRERGEGSYNASKLSPFPRYLRAYLWNISLYSQSSIKHDCCYLSVFYLYSLLMVCPEIDQAVFLIFIRGDRENEPSCFSICLQGTYYVMWPFQNNYTYIMRRQDSVFKSQFLESHLVFSVSYVLVVVFVSTQMKQSETPRMTNCDKM